LAVGRSLHIFHHPPFSTMVIDPKDVVPFLVWLLPGALLNWLLVVACVVLAATAFGWLIAALRHGPGRATWITVAVIRQAVLDLVRLSPRRSWALARLAVQESIRRRVVVVFAVFILILLFAGWFLDPGSVDPARLYLDFVLTATSYLVLLLALFLSSLSLPADLKSRTIYTIVTKPVRSSELVLGRIVGFTAVGTLLLAVMGVISYFFVVRGLAHTHQLTADDLQPAEGTMAGRPPILRGRTSRVHQHRHKVAIEPSGETRVDREQGHVHELTVATNGEETTYELGQPEEMLLARVPVYGRLAFLDRTGKETDKGVNVGDEWTYRSYVEGGTLAAFEWTFAGITEDAFPDGLPVEMSIEVFRTYKGDIEKGVPGSLSVRNPQTGKKLEVLIFESKEYAIDSHLIPRVLRMPDGKKVDLFEEFVDDGRIEILLQCVAPSQYFGAAQADLYLRASDASFPLNFVKGYFGIWLQMLLVITLGVTFSTFLSGPVAMLATLGALLGGFFNDYMFRLATGQTYGGGPFESIIRLLTQQNVTSEMEPGLRTTVAQSLDQAAELALRAMSMILPDFGHYNFAEYVASGFNISGGTLLIFACRGLAFVVPVFIVGYLCLKNREIGK
jgi:ABC-type transport system involved in multi-copper enzyme maturation permease subunit